MADNINPSDQDKPPDPLHAGTNAKEDPVITLSAGKTSNNEPTETPEQRFDRRMSNFERWTTRLAIAGVVVAAVTGYIFYKQLDVMSGQLTQMINSGTQTDNMIGIANEIKEQMEETVKQNKVALNATLKENRKALDTTIAHSKRALDTSIESYKLDQRAWLGVGTFSIINFEKDKPIKVDIEIINSGRTPAINVEEGFAIGWLSRDYYDPPRNVGDMKSKLYFNKWFSTLKYHPAQSVAPQGKFHMLPGGNYPNSLYDDVKAKKIILYIYGEIKYTDIFSTPCSTTICLYMDNPDNPKLMFCEKYNDLK